MGALILRFVYPRTSPARHARLMRWWSRKLLRILAVRPVVHGPAPHWSGPVMVVANHVSWLDIFVISSVRATRFIAKREIREWPLVGWIVEKAGTLFLKREARRDLARMGEQVHEALARQDCVGLFPEGTTTEGTHLLKFHGSLFEPAIRNAARIVPVVLRYETPAGALCANASFAGEITFMQCLARIVRERAIVARMEFLEPVEAAGRDRRELAASLHAVIASRLQAWDREPRTPHGPPAGSR
ncbi:MAG TPA: lysophospholipid acyltransferase family protein [Usitatibacter sp.]|jgi:1-acyl-sn-glycerol-3-phosphate acyltransferase|nr:lysophospholipid acyltransferase family protein [Usitatibacter sp.]